METSLTKPIPRVVRFVPAVIHAGRRLAAHLDRERNVLTVDQTIFDQLSPQEQDRIIKTTASIEAVRPSP